MARPADTVVQVHGGREGLARAGPNKEKDMDDEFDWDRDETVDLDCGGYGSDATGNPALDIDGYSSPSRKGQNLTGYEPSKIDQSWLEQSRADRARRQARRREAAHEADDRDKPRWNWSGVVGLIGLAWVLIVPVFVLHPWLLWIFAPPAAVGVCSLGYLVWSALRRQSPPSPRPARAQSASRGRGGGQVTARPVPVEPVQDSAAEIARRSLTELQPGQHGAYFEKRTHRPWYAPWKKVVRWQQISAWQNTTPPTSGTEVVTVGNVAELPGKVRTIGKVGPTGAVEY